MSRDDLEAQLHRATGVLAGVADAGDRIATCQPNSVRSFSTSWAMMLAGVVEMPVPTSASAEEAHHILADARPSALLVEADAPGVRAAAEDLEVRVLQDVPGPATAPSASHPRTRPMSYTSGTTGQRKGVHAGVHDEAWGRSWLADEREAFGHRHGDRHLVVSPLYHSGPLRHALVCADAGGTVQVLPHFDVADWVEALRRFRPTSMFCVPTHLRRLLAHPGLRSADLSSLSLLVHAGAPCPVDLKRQLHRLAPVGAVWEFYGSTEGQFTSCPPDVWEAAPGTVGRARPDREVTIRDRDGRIVDPGVRGTVWATAPPHARWEYWGLPAATDRAWEDDAFTVGDVGHLDTEGRLFLHGREGDLVITGGVNVYPAEVEEALRTIAGVADVAVFGLPDDDWGERVVAAVVPVSGSGVTPATVVAAARDRLSPARVPKQVVLCDDLPRTPTGKVSRADLPPLVEDLVSTGRLDRLQAQLRNHAPREHREERSLRRTLAMLDWLRAPFDETADPTHVTASAIVLGGDGRVLLHRHKRLGIWLQPGGHVDPGETCEQAALREVAEETGVTGDLADRAPLHVDVHQGPRGHVHLDVRWLVHAPAGVVPAPAAGESQDVAWFDPVAALAHTDVAASNAIRAALDC